MNRKTIQAGSTLFALLLFAGVAFGQDAVGRTGLQIRQENGKILVIGMERWGPAKKAGLQPGDVLIRVNDTPVEGFTPDQVAALTRGPVGSPLTITVLRNNLPQLFNLVREDLSSGKLGFWWQGGQDLPRIFLVQADSPADKAGIKAGDYVQRVDDTDLKGRWNPSDLEPPAGTEVSLAILRQGKGAPMIFSLIAAPLDEVELLNRKANLLRDQGKFEEGAAANRMAADKGDPQAQHILGTLYIDGKGVPRDSKEALKWLKKAADQGFELSIDAIGRIYADGQGVKKDPEQAFEWHKKGADRGNPNCQYIVGWDYKYGAGTKPDNMKSFKYHQMAAQMGEVHSLNDLAVFYMNGEDVPRDIPKALSLFQQSWERGEPIAALNIGLIHKLGLDVPVDYEEASKWFRLAAEKGNTMAQDELKKLPQVTFLSNEVEPPEIHPGQSLKINSILEVSGLQESGTLTVTMERQIVFQDQPLFHSPKTETQTLVEGRHTTSFEFATPGNAAPGMYKTVITVRAMGAETTKETFFVIRP